MGARAGYSLILHQALATKPVSAAIPGAYYLLPTMSLRTHPIQADIYSVFSHF